MFLVSQIVSNLLFLSTQEIILVVLAILIKGGFIFLIVWIILKFWKKRDKVVNKRQEGQ